MGQSRALLISVIGAQLRSDHDLTLSDRQLLSIVVLFCDHNVAVTELIDRLFHEFGSLSAIISASSVRLSQIDGMTDRLISFFRFLYTFRMHSLRSALQDRPRITSSDDLKEYLVSRLRDVDLEELHVLFLDNNFHLLNGDTLWRGTNDRVAAYPIEILKRAVNIGAARIILAHNHPSRRPSPSQDDIHFSVEVAKLCLPMKIILQDHLIIAGDDWISLKDYQGEVMTHIFR